MKVLIDDPIKSLEFATIEQLKRFRDEINCKIQYRENEKLNELKEDALAVLKDFFDAGGSIIAGGHDYSMIGEDFNLDEPIIFLS